jgi:hypothetical protein
MQGKEGGEWKRVRRTKVSRQDVQGLHGCGVFDEERDQQEMPDARLLRAANRGIRKQHCDGVYMNLIGI